MMRKLSEGVYIEELNGVMIIHLDIPEMLAWAGFEDTEPNRDLMLSIAQRAVKKAFPDIPTTVLDAMSEAPKKRRETNVQ
jgi:hypothetical protein